MKNLMSILIVTMTLVGCGEQEAAKTGGSSISAVVESTPVYTYTLSGNGVTFSLDLHGYAETGWAGTHTNPTYSLVLLGATPLSYTLTAKSMIANITLNTGAGVLTINTYKNGALIRSDTINTNATSISINN